jgi:ubiquinol-cytochrome c reductase cytochrome b subunit
MKTIYRFCRAVPGRIGWDKALAPFLFKKLPSRTGWAITLGSASVLMFILMYVTGIFLAIHYNPSPDKAYQSIDYIMHEVPAGAILRGLHHWGASAMVIVVFLHMLSSFFSGSYKKPREGTWITGVILFLIVLALGFTGYLLPWDLKAYWATTVSTNIPKDLPVVGKFASHLMLGGDTISGSTLTRFYAIHAMLLPLLLAGLIAFHIFLVRLHGVAEHTNDESLGPADAEPLPPAPEAAPQKPYRFFPEHLFRASLVFAAIFLVLIGLTIWAHIPREPVAGTQVDNYLPRPEWYYMWLFQLLTYFPGKSEAVGSLAIPLLGLLLLLGVPFFGRRNNRLGVRNRPLPLAIGVTAIVGLTFLTVMGFAGAEPYGQVFVVPNRTLTASEMHGLRVYANRECAYCHQIDGQGGHRVGPDFSNLLAKHPTREYLERYIRDPQLVNRTSIMPKYDLPDSDLSALTDFLLSLDGSKFGFKTLTRQQVLGDASVK